MSIGLRKKNRRTDKQVNKKIERRAVKKTERKSISITQEQFVKQDNDFICKNCLCSKVYQITYMKNVNEKDVPKTEIFFVNPKIFFAKPFC